MELQATLQAPNTPIGVATSLEPFADRYQAYFPRVFAYVYGRVRNTETAEDIASEVFERAFIKADSLRNEEAFGAWLFTIARNMIASHGRRQARQNQSVSTEIVNSLPHHDAPVDSGLLLQEEVRSLMIQVKKLPTRDQEIISLKFDAELTNGQIARILCLNEGNVRVIVFRSLRKLREMMTRDLEQDSTKNRRARLSIPRASAR